MKAFRIFQLFLIVLLAGVFAGPLYAQQLEKDFDALILKQYQPGGPGAAVLVAKNGQVIYRKAFGMANIELGVEMRPEMVFEVGSITKQFTAVAILMLMEQGKLSLDDEINKYIEDYPTEGHRITIHHLLTHTSGIKSYTSLEAFKAMGRQDMSPLEIIDLIKKQPMDFAPGEKFLYNNSAFFILGYVIEKVSGQSYQDFIEEHIFKPLRMDHSYYGSHSRIIPGRAAGYQNVDGFVNAEYLSLTLPYAAGSIMSNVDDLLKWTMAIRDNKLVSQETTAKAFTNYTLNDGTPIHYGYGWFLNEINGSPTIEHGGAIFGYTTNGIWLPEEDVYVVMLTNRDDRGPDDISARLAAMAIGKPYPEGHSGIALSDSVLKVFEGNYEFEDGAFRKIFFEDGALYSQRGGSTRFRLIPVSDHKFNCDGALSTIEFITGENGMVEAIFSRRVEQFRGHKTDKEMVTRNEISLDPEDLEPFVGNYEIQPGFSIRIMLEGGHLYGQATGQERFEMFAESATKFFLKVVDAQIEFIKNDDGVFDSLILFQAGQQIKGVKK